LAQVKLGRMPSKLTLLFETKTMKAPENIREKAIPIIAVF
jgi:hypothetical protein